MPQPNQIDGKNKEVKLCFRGEFKFCLCCSYSPDSSLSLWLQGWWTESRTGWENVDKGFEWQITILLSLSWDLLGHTNVLTNSLSAWFWSFLNQIPHQTHLAWPVSNEQSICVPTCGWSVSPVDWTWFLPGSAAGQRCFSPSSYVLPQDPLLGTHILKDLLTCLDHTHTHTQRLHTHKHTIQKATRTSDIQHFIVCHWKSDQPAWLHGPKPHVDNLEAIQWICLSGCTTHSSFSLTKWIHYFTQYWHISYRPKQKCRAMTPCALSVSLGHSHACESKFC